MSFFVMVQSSESVSGVWCWSWKGEGSWLMSSRGRRFLDLSPAIFDQRDCAIWLTVCLSEMRRPEGERAKAMS